MSNKFRVRPDMDHSYAVDEFIGYDEDEYPQYEQVFSGSLSDCEAYIRLKQNEEVDF